LLLPQKAYPEKAIPLLSDTGFHARVVSVNVSINQVSSAYPTQSPALAFMGFRWILGSLKGRYIFRQSTLFWIYAFISVFSKIVGIWEKDIKNHMRKRI